MSASAGRWKLVVVPWLVLLMAGTAGWGYYRWRYPYGYSHSCDKGLWLALESYADEHGGAYPTGGETPEASLSLLAEVLRGKILPLDVVKAILDRGEPLGPETCGWHYVEGLRQSDGSNFALFWDKAGLGHFGERLPQGGHEVFFVGSGYRYIPESDWPAFLEEQERLQAKRRQGGQ
jgi:hypothetical protein